MVKALRRTISGIVLGMALAYPLAAIADGLAPNHHMLVLDGGGDRGFALVFYASALVCTGFGAVVGAVFGGAEMVADAVRKQP
jgi:hypothetical protein